MIRLEGDLQGLMQWFTDNGISANPSKCQIMFLGLKGTNKLCLNMKGQLIPSSQHVKLLVVNLIESETPCHEAQVVGPYRDLNPLRLTVLVAMSGDYTTAPQRLPLIPIISHLVAISFRKVIWAIVLHAMKRFLQFLYVG